jgi:hypothetical protein
VVKNSAVFSSLRRLPARLAAALVAAALSIPAAAVAQDPGGIPQPGAEAMEATVLNALPAFMHRDVLTGGGSPALLHLRYGIRATDDDVRTHAFGATGEWPVWRGRLGITAAMQRSTNFTAAMGHLEYQTRMSRGRLTPDPTGPILNLTMKLEAGLGTTVDGDLERTAFSSGISVFMAVPFGVEVMVVPFVSPGFGFGMLSRAGEVDYGPNVFFSGGVVLHNPSRFDLTVGAHRVVAENTRTMYGIGLTWNR